MSENKTDIKKKLYHYTSNTKNKGELYLALYNVEDEAIREGSPLEEVFEYCLYSDCAGNVELLHSGICFDDPDMESVHHAIVEVIVPEKFKEFYLKGETDFSLFSELIKSADFISSSLGNHSTDQRNEASLASDGSPIERTQGFFERLFGRRK